MTTVNKVNLIARSAVGVLIGHSRRWCLGFGIDWCFEDLFNGSVGHDSGMEGVSGDEGSIIPVDLHVAGYERQSE